MLSGIGSEVGVLNFLIIVSAIIVKIFGPPWKWGRKVPVGNPGVNTVNTKVKVAVTSTELEGFRRLCDEKHKNLEDNIGEIKEDVKGIKTHLELL